MKNLNKIKLFAIDSDGVLLNDTYSPVIKRFVEMYGGVYNAQVERHVWGSPQITAGHNMALACKLPWSGERTIAEFFKVRNSYLVENPVKVLPNIRKTLEMLHATGAKLVCYGGRNKEYSFDKFLYEYQPYFDLDIPYVDINNFRPGVHEIVKDYFHLEHDEVVFIDDINRVAEVCKKLNSGFIGIPANMKHNYQKQEMQETGVKFACACFSDITLDMIMKLDRMMLSSQHWS